MTTARGGKRPGAGRKRGTASKPIPFKYRQYRVPQRFLTEATDEIKAILKKYREKCRTT